MASLFDHLLPPRGHPEPRPYSPYAPIRTRRPRRPHGGDAAPPTARERAVEIERIAHQLAHVTQTVPWGRVQDDAWDGLSRFIYRKRTASSVRSEATAVALAQRIEATPFVQYALRRWYCFWGARMAELMFLDHPGVEPGPPKDHEVDFTLDGVPFDLKTSEVPRVFLGSIEELAASPTRIASWLYAHQSRQGRFHNANRLFLLLCDRDEPEEAWRLRADAPALRRAIDRFMARRHLAELELPDRGGRVRRALTAVIPVLPAPGPRQMTMALGSGVLAAPRPAVAPPAASAPRTLPLF